jgi:mono/diheme cytochrome c family protein
MVFALGGETELAEPPKRDRSIPEQPPLTASAEELARGDELYHQFCFGCHGYEVRGARNADLRMMAPAIHDAFQGIVREGLLRELGMNGFADALSEVDVELVRQYIISRANLDRAAEAEQL